MYDVFSRHAVTTVDSCLGRRRWKTGALRVVARGFEVRVSTNALENTHHNRTSPRFTVSHSES